MKYPAKTDYQSQTSARTYEQRAMYSGVIGRRRVRIETRVISDLIAALPPNSRMLDCPCGNGRWFGALAQRASVILARDVSEGMVAAATERASREALSVDLDIRLGDAEALDLADASVDHVFSYALMKHLPVPIQYRVLAEFARVSRRSVLCSFAVFGHLSYAYWRRRRPAASYPLLKEELENMIEAAGLKLDRLVKVSQPVVGLEYFAVMSKRDG